MMFDLSTHLTVIKSVLAQAFLFGLAVSMASAQPTAVVPLNVIYPGEKISTDKVKLVDVVNPNLRPGYAKIFAEVEGLVTTKTLLPGRTIPVKALREAYLVERGKTVSLVYAANGMILTAQAIALQNGALGEMIQARNVDSGLTVTGTIMEDGSIRATLR